MVNDKWLMINGEWFCHNFCNGCLSNLW